MKRLLASTLMVTSLATCSSCSHDKEAIEEAAYQYAMATSNYEVADAAPYATQETQNTTLVFAENILKSVGEDYIKSDTPANIEIVSVQIINDTESVAVYHKTTPLKNFIDTLTLRKRANRWLVHVPLPKTARPLQETPKGSLQMVLSEDATKKREKQ